jgi:hypothetical protein
MFTHHMNLVAMAKTPMEKDTAYVVCWIVYHVFDKYFSAINIASQVFQFKTRLCQATRHKVGLVTIFFLLEL